jgi:hypothetical protein
MAPAERMESGEAHKVRGAESTELKRFTAEKYDKAMYKWSRETKVSHKLKPYSPVRITCRLPHRAP